MYYSKIKIYKSLQDTYRINDVSHCYQRNTTYN